MPIIKQARITNFTYNHGQIRIGDEIIDFIGESLDPTPSSCINLRNGGGKSTLILAMLQACNCTAGRPNIFPEIKEDAEEKKKRYRIEDYFQGTSESGGYPHSFILLEWKKDESDEYVVTGVAITGTPTKEKKDESRNTVNYYHFYTEYSDNSASNPFSLSGMQLSFKRNGKLYVQDFEYIRNLSGQNPNYLHCFNKEDASSYHAKLSEFGIPIEGIKLSTIMCSSENGISDYFGKMNNRKLIEDYFIGRIIEVGLSKFYKNRSDKNVRDITCAQIKKRNESSELYEKKQIYERLNKEFDAILDTVNKTIFLPIKERNSAMSESVGLLKAVQNENDNICEQLEEIDVAIQNYEEHKMHIKLEEASKKLHDSIDKIETLQKDKEELEKLIDTNTNQRDALNKRRDLLECAKYYQEIANKESQIGELQNQITLKESNSGEAERLNNLKYSVKIKIEPQIRSLEDKIKSAKEEDLSCQQQQDLLNKEKTQKESDYTAKCMELNRISGELSNLQKDTDKLHDELKIPGTRRMDNFYSSEETQKEYEKKQKELDEARSSISNAKTEREQLDTDQEKLREEASEITKRKAQNEIRSKVLKDELEEYKTAKCEVIKVLSEYEKKEDDLYTGTLPSFFSEKIADKNARIETLSQNIRLKENDARNIENNVFYYEDDVISAIDQTGISYQTGEEFINNAIPKTTDSDKENLHGLLDRHPEIVYSIIVDAEKERDSLIKRFPINTVTHSITPVFTRNEINAFLNSESTNGGKYIYAFNEQLLFEGKEAFLSKLKKEIEANKIDLEKSMTTKKELSDAANIIQAFINKYNQDWKLNAENETHRLEELIDSDSRREVEIKESILAKKERSNILFEEIQKQTKKESSLESWIRLYKDLTFHMAEEIKKVLKKKDAQSAVDQTKKTLQKIQQDIADVTKRIADLNSEINRCASSLEACMSAFSDVKTATTGTLLKEDWQNLYQMYKTARSALEETIGSIREKINQLKYEIHNDQENLNIKSSKYKKEEYENLVPSAKEEYQCQIEAKEKQEIIDSINQMLLSKTADLGMYINVKNSAIDSIERLGYKKTDALPKNEIGQDFKKRLLDVEKSISSKKSEYKALEDKKRNNESTINEIRFVIEENGLQDIEVAEIVITNSKAQWDSLRSVLSIKKNTISRGKNDLQLYFNRIFPMYEKVDGFDTFVSSTVEYIRREDIDSAENYILKTQDIIEKTYLTYKSDLEHIEKDMDIVVEQAMQQAETIYNAFLKIAATAKLTLDGSKKPLIDIKIPKQIDKTAAKARIEGYIHQLSDETIKKIKEKEPKDINHFISDEVNQNLGNATLLYKYINTDNIPVLLFKFDSCSETRKLFPFDNFKHSTGEGTASYSILLLVGLNYLFSPTGIISSRGTATLFLDNPFGAASSEALTKPMFSLAKELKVQMICVTGHNEHVISELFDQYMTAKVIPISRGYRLMFDGSSDAHISTLDIGAHSTSNLEKANNLLDREQISLFDESSN